MPELHCETITFPSSDGRHTSSAVLYTMPGKPVRAVLQLSHGMCEYVRRYAPMAEFYAAHGIALAGNDHLGHSFFVFRNTDDDNAICVVYTRNSGGYGIIETGEQA